MTGKSVTFYMGKAQRELEDLRHSDRCEAARVWIELARLAVSLAPPPGALPTGRASVAGSARRAAAGEVEAQGWPCADDGSEYPGVIHEASGRYVGKCPACGEHTAEYRGNLLRCTGKPGGKPCRTSWPKDVVERLIALSGGDA